MKNESGNLNISASIKALRSDYGLTQDELGKIAGVSGKAVWTWENETALPRMGAIEKMSLYFNIPKSQIIDGTFRRLSAYPKATAEDALLFDKIRKLDDTDRARIEERIDTMLESDKYKKDEE